MSAARLLIGDVRERMAEIPDGSIDLVLTSPPFLALRAYLDDDHPDKALEIGTEPDPAGYIDTLLGLAGIWRRKLAPHGSLVVELGDTYAGSGSPGGDYNEGGQRAGQLRPTYSGRRATRKPKSPALSAKDRGLNEGSPPDRLRTRRHLPGWPLDKSMCGIPHLFHLSLAYGRNVLREPLSARELLDYLDELTAAQPTLDVGALLNAGRLALDLADHAAGPLVEIEPWRVRNVIAWCRPNPAVGALGDKFRPATSYLTVACMARTGRYFDLDAVRTEPKTRLQRRFSNAWGQRGGDPMAIKYGDNYLSDEPSTFGNAGGVPPYDWWSVPWAPEPPGDPEQAIEYLLEVVAELTGDGDPLDRDSWEIPASNYPGSHYATWPAALIEPIIESMCPRKVCTTCGEPQRRIVATEGTGQNTRKAGVAADDPRQVGAVSSTEVPDVAVRHHLGWTDCGHGTWRNGLVLDPFAGSGTTLAVASGHGRDSIGIDLDGANVALVEQRVGMFLEDVDYGSSRPQAVVEPVNG